MKNPKNALKMGGFGTKNGWNLVFSHAAQDTAHSWFWACLTQTVHIRGIFGHFWAVSGTCCGARGKKGLLAPGNRGARAMQQPFSLRLSVLTGFRGRLGPKKAVLGHKMYSFGRVLPDLAPPPRGATGEVLAENLDVASAPPRL